MPDCLGEDQTELNPSDFTGPILPRSATRDGDWPSKGEDKNENGCFWRQVETGKTECIPGEHPLSESYRVAMAASEDPERTIEAKILTDPEAIPFLGKFFSIFKLSPQISKQRSSHTVS